MISEKMKMATKAGAAALGLALTFAPLLAAPQTVSPAGNADKGKALFDSSSCGTCHTLAAAGAVGDIGPSLDHDAKLSHDLIVARVKKGQGAMPPYGGQMSEQDVNDVAAYVLGAAAK